ncbi:MAG: hypothetical protein RL065_1348 [Bacteroidota bacterium]|jgi:hypothetical protein
MQSALYSFRNNQFIQDTKSDTINQENVQLVLGFGAKKILSDSNIFNELKSKFTNAHIVLSSTAGEIYDNEVMDDSVSITAIHFEKTTIKTSVINISDFENSTEAGKNLMLSLSTEQLQYVLVLSDGGLVNGSQLVEGINSVINHKVPVTGGLAGDGKDFNSTLVGCDEKPSVGKIVAIGFYGSSLKVAHGTLGGWEMFGLEKTITKSTNNVLSEIDDANALDLYKNYLGKYADELPGSALLFPLAVKLPDTENAVVRTILSIDNTAKTMTFAGDVPIGSKVRFMKANFDKLVEAANTAANQTLTNFSSQPKVAILISCVGRKLILDKRIDEEVEAVREVLGDKTLITGFYSYGEISPFNENANCTLHNQTMTITTFDEL